MDHVLIRIKRAVLAGRFEFTTKALMELDRDDLTDSDVAEAILNASRINKRLRSVDSRGVPRGDVLYVIIAENLTGIPIYTKGKLVGEEGSETYYLLISSKRPE